MKPFISLCSAALIAATAHAQPTFTAATNTPAPGTTYSINYGPYVAPGGAGANQTWNLTGLTTDSSTTVQRVLPSATMNGAQFPTATVAEESAAVTQYFRVAADGIHFAGSDDGTSVIVHAPMGKHLPFPCTFGTVWSSPQHATFTYDDMTVTRTGTFSGQVDGYGTLIMPGGTINNVLRVRWTHTLQDAMGPMTINHLYDSFAFFQAGQAHPIAELVTATINVGGGPITNQFSRWTGDITTGIDAAVPMDLVLSPNPAHEEVQLRLPAEFGTRAAVSVMDMAGRAVQLGHYHAGAGITVQLDVRSLRAGRYQLLVIGDNGRRASAPLLIQ